MTLPPAIEWIVEPGLLDYSQAVSTMEDRVAAIRAGKADEMIWLVEHPPLYTAGTSAVETDVLDARWPVFVSGRGGRHTYHGPGQRIAYVMLDLDRRGRDVRCFVAALELWVVEALATLGITAHVVPGRVGVWTRDDRGEAKIAAIGIRVRRWVTFHGVAINVATHLEHFGGIVPCGLDDARVTSVTALGRRANFGEIDQALLRALPQFLKYLSHRRTCAMALEEMIVSG